MEPGFHRGGRASWLLLIFVGATPLARASGLALAILGVTASMRQMGYVASIAGGLTLALCPVFWSQTGGSETQAGTLVVASTLAALVAVAASSLLKRRDASIGMGVAAFLLIFWSQIGTAQSLRLTGLVTAWLLYLLADMILLTNPRPGIKPAKEPKPWHTWGLLFLFVVGALNDPAGHALRPGDIAGALPFLREIARLVLAGAGGGCLRRFGSACARVPAAAAEPCRLDGLARGGSLD